MLVKGATVIVRNDECDDDDDDDYDDDGGDIDIGNNVNDDVEKEDVSDLNFYYISLKHNPRFVILCQFHACSITNIVNFKCECWHVPFSFCCLK